MKNQLFTFTCACLLIILLTGCHTGKKASLAYKGSRQPKFIKGIYLDGHNKSSATVNAIAPKKAPVYLPTKKAEEPVYVNKVVAADKVRSVAEPGPLVITPVKKEPATTFDLVSDNLVGAKYADMIGLDGRQMTNQELYRFIDKWYGTNYRLGGHNEAGIDCSGFAQKLYGEVYGVDLTRTAMDQYKNCERVKRADNAEEGDLVFFKQRSKRITHVGVYLANDYFIHASTSSGVVISSLKEEYWHKHYAGAGKVPKVEKL